MRKNHIFLIGFMGSGKSTVAKYLSSAYQMKQIEMDEQIEKNEGRSISSIFEKEGEEYFRTLETELLKSLDPRETFVVSCGGGAAVKEENVREMKEKGRIILLSAQPETVYVRVKNSHNRPLLEGNMNVSYIKELMDKRQKLYERAADFQVKTDGRTAEDIGEEIIKQIRKEEETA
ncbi:Shikimate kinase [uncultured Blautia sp.]